MVDVEYVARVVVERVERRLVPKGTPTGRRAMATSEDRLVHDKTEVLSFTVRDKTRAGIQVMASAMLREGLPTVDVKGEPETQQDEEEEDDL